MENVDFALQYASRGWYVFPLSPRSKKPLKNTRGFHDASTSERCIERFWDINPGANIGIATGKKSGFIGLDVDGEKGSRSLTKLETELGPLPETLEQITGSRKGRQLIFKWPATREVRNKQNLRPGIDIRGEGGYIVVPPSIHPSGGVYEWPYGDQTPIAELPPAWLDFICPPKKNIPPWERLEKAQSKPVLKPLTSTPIIERAKEYLAKCEPAIQGSGGHDALLWAARCLVIGFELDDATAISLLWSEYNPRCVPQWNSSNVSDKRDFERKVSEVRRTPGEKPRGWLKDECGLRSGQDALAQIAQGKVSARVLLEKHIMKTQSSSNSMKADPFPVHVFPKSIQQLIAAIAEAERVEPQVVALPLLTVSGAALGNTVRLRLKANSFDVSPTIWGVIVAPSGSKKSGAFRRITAPLREPIPIERIRNPMLTPSGKLVLEDITPEELVRQLAVNPRGSCIVDGELSQWATSFSRYRDGATKGKPGAGDSIWIKAWDNDSYQRNRRGDGEDTFVPIMACSVTGTIQPKVLAACFDPLQFASGLVPRLYFVRMERKARGWSDEDVTTKDIEFWGETLLRLRVTPFKALDSNKGQYLPHILRPDDEAKKIFIEHYLEMDKIIDKDDDVAAIFASKAQGGCGRIALILHGLECATQNKEVENEVISGKVMCNAVELVQYLLSEQLKTFGVNVKVRNKERASQIANWLHKQGGKATISKYLANHSKQCSTVDDARAELNRAVEAGFARWTGKECVLIDVAKEQ
jgi:hypothetical protein